MYDEHICLNFTFLQSSYYYILLIRYIKYNHDFIQNGVPQFLKALVDLNFMSVYSGKVIIIAELCPQ